MSKLVRKISFNKWDYSDNINSLEYEDFPSKALTNDIKIGDDETLSVWKLDEDEMNLEDIVLALASTMDAPSKIELIFLLEPNLKVEGITIKEKIGNSPTFNINESHRDLANLVKISDVCKVARQIYSSMELEHYKAYTKKEVENIILNGVKEKKIDYDRLNKKLKEYIDKKDVI